MIEQITRIEVSFDSDSDFGISNGNKDYERLMSVIDKIYTKYESYILVDDYCLGHCCKDPSILFEIEYNPELGKQIESELKKAINNSVYYVIS